MTKRRHDTFLNDALALSFVTRWTTVNTVRYQSVADHAYRAALIAYEIYRVYFTSNELVRPFNLLWHALTHDVDEAILGDIPSPAKKFLRPRRDIPTDALPRTPDIDVTITEMAITNLADKIEAVTFIRRHGCGPHAKRIEDRLMQVIAMTASEAGITPDAMYALIDYIGHERDDAWRRE